MEYEIACHYSPHEGGTKAYQLWKVGRGSEWVTVHQWGKLGAVIPYGPGGEAKVQPYSREGLASKDIAKMVREKSARGYDDWQTKIRRVGAGSLEKTLNHLFGSTVAAKVRTNLGIATVTPDPELENLDKGPTMSPVKEEKVDRGPEWGVW